MTDRLFVRTKNRDALDETLRPLGGLVAMQPESDGSYEVRGFPPEKLSFVRFAIEQQGYAQIVEGRSAG